jgi:hypothetical protein
VILQREGYQYRCGCCGTWGASAYSRQRFCSAACKNEAKRRDLAYVRGVILRARRYVERIKFAAFVRMLWNTKGLLQLPFSLAYKPYFEPVVFFCRGPSKVPV